MTTPAPNPEAVHLASNARWTEPAGDLPVFERPAWQALAACRGMDPDLFMPERGQTLKAEAAKAVCARCPVTEPCLEQALADNEQGIWGSTSHRERLVMQGRARRRGAA